LSPAIAAARFVVVQVGTTAAAFAGIGRPRTPLVTKALYARGTTITGAAGANVASRPGAGRAVVGAAATMVDVRPEADTARTLATGHAWRVVAGRLVGLVGTGTGGNLVAPGPAELAGHAAATTGPAVGDVLGQVAAPPTGATGIAGVAGTAGAAVADTLAVGTGIALATRPAGATTVAATATIVEVLAIVHG